VALGEGLGFNVGETGAVGSVAQQHGRVWQGKCSCSVCARGFILCGVCRMWVRRHIKIEVQVCVEVCMELFEILTISVAFVKLT
jgi:hypothetical protein